jgi:hypothetical protein
MFEESLWLLADANSQDDGVAGALARAKLRLARTLEHKDPAQARELARAALPWFAEQVPEPNRHLEEQLRVAQRLAK